MLGQLILEDGTIFTGRLMGKTIKAAEVIFHTGLNGYEELLKEKAYDHQILVLPYPLQGNYGVKDLEPRVGGPVAMVMAELSLQPSHYLAQGTLAQYLEANDISCLYDVDTRSLVMHLRGKGIVKGGIFPLEVNAEEAHQSLLKNLNLNSASNKTFTEAVNIPGLGSKIGIIDLGCGWELGANLEYLQSNINIWPPNVTCDEIKGFAPEMLLISDGPGSPELREAIVHTLQEFKGRLPIFGFGLGAFLAAALCGGQSYQLPTGLRGSYNPVQDIKNQKVNMLCIKTGYGLQEQNFPENLEITHRHLNTKNILGFRDSNLRVKGIVFAPFGQPGPKLEGQDLEDLLSFAMREKN